MDISLEADIVSVVSVQSYQMVCITDQPELEINHSNNKKEAMTLSKIPVTNPIPTYLFIHN